MVGRLGGQIGRYRARASLKIVSILNGLLVPVDGAAGIAAIGVGNDLFSLLYHDLHLLWQFSPEYAKHDCLFSSAMVK